MQSGTSVVMVDNSTKQDGIYRLCSSAEGSQCRPDIEFVLQACESNHPHNSIEDHHIRFQVRRSWRQQQCKMRMSLPTSRTANGTKAAKEANLYHELMVAGKHGCSSHLASCLKHSYGVSRCGYMDRLDPANRSVGFPYSFGIFQAYYSTHEPFASEASGVAAIGTTATGLMFFGLPFGAMVAQRFPRIVRLSVVIGISVVVLSLIGASFCNSVSGLIVTEGIFYAIGGVLAYLPLLKLVDEWFIVRKGMAYGVMWAGTGFAGVIVPFLLEWLLDSYGFRTALRVWAIIIVWHSIVWMKPSCLLFDSHFSRCHHSSSSRTDCHCRLRALCVHQTSHM
jgi:hypothetical protein